MDTDSDISWNENEIFEPSVEEHELYVDKHRAAALEKIKQWSDYINKYLDNGVPFKQIPMDIDPDTGETILVPNDFDQQDYVYHSYDMDTYNHEALKLPIAKYKYQILKELEFQQVVIVQSSTGSGKTTQIPQYILDHYAKMKRKCNIVVTQPRRIAAQSVASRVCSERGWKVGELVGYQVGLMRKASENTRLMYMTTGVLLQIINGTQSLKNRYSHIIIDEVHERDILTDLLLATLVKVMVETGDTVTKIIVMSATMDCTKFLNYFPKWNVEHLITRPKILDIEQDTCFNIKEYYLHDLTSLMGFHANSLVIPLISNPKLFNSLLPELHAEVEKIFPVLIECLDYLERQNPLFNVESGNNIGGVLVFLPGQMEIESLRERCIKYVNENENPHRSKWEIQPLYSNLNYDEQKKIFRPVERGSRKIILATNIAESSITVPDVKYVVDFCLHKVNTCDKGTKHTCLLLEWVSKQEATQRKGRVGRVSNGFVFRMVPLSFYNSLSKESIPEMKRCALENVILDVKTLRLGPPTSILALALDPPTLSSIHDAVLTLKEVGAFAPDNDNFQAFDGVTTSLGTFVSKLPVDVRVGKLIAMGYIFGVLEYAIIIAARLSGKDLFVCSSSTEVESYMSRLYWSGENFSDPFAILALYREWYTKVQNGDFTTVDSMYDWCKTNYVDLKCFREMTVFIEDIELRISKNFAIQIDKCRFLANQMNEVDEWMIRLSIAAGFYPFYCVNKPPDQETYRKRLEREFYGRDPLNTVVFDGYPNGHPTKLYAAYIEKHTDPENKKVLRVSSESDKAFVSFEGTATRGNVPVDIYEAVKKRLVGSHVVLKTLVTTSKSTFKPNNGYANICNLKGPKSILEMDFFCITKICSYRNVSVDRFSVNSVALDPLPGLERLQLLVCCEVTATQNSSIKPKSTTLFPPKLGIPELCVLLFGPQVQLRRETAENRYTSCISGLGYIKEHLMPVFPDHDLDIDFRTKITKRDIDRINDFRIAMCDIFSRIQLQDNFKNESEGMDDPKIQLLRLRLMDFLTEEKVPAERIVELGDPYTWCMDRNPQDDSEQETMDDIFKKEYQIYSLLPMNAIARTSSEFAKCKVGDGIKMFHDF